MKAFSKLLVINKSRQFDILLESIKSIKNNHSVLYIKQPTLLDIFS